MHRHTCAHTHYLTTSPNTHLEISFCELSSPEGAKGDSLVRSSKMSTPRLHQSTALSCPSSPPLMISGAMYSTVPQYEYVTCAIFVVRGRHINGCDTYAPLPASFPCWGQSLWAPGGHLCPAEYSLALYHDRQYLAAIIAAQTQKEFILRTLASYPM